MAIAEQSEASNPGRTTKGAWSYMSLIGLSVLSTPWVAVKRRLQTMQTADCRLRMGTWRSQTRAHILMHILSRVDVSGLALQLLAVRICSST